MVNGNLIFNFSVVEMANLVEDISSYVLNQHWETMGSVLG